MLLLHFLRELSQDDAMDKDDAIRLLKSLSSGEMIKLEECDDRASRKAPPATFADESYGSPIYTSD